MHWGMITMLPVKPTETSAFIAFVQKVGSPTTANWPGSLDSSAWMSGVRSAASGRGLDDVDLHACVAVEDRRGLLDRPAGRRDVEHDDGGPVDAVVGRDLRRAGEGGDDAVGHDRDPRRREARRSRATR